MHQDMEELKARLNGLREILNSADSRVPQKEGGLRKMIGSYEREMERLQGLMVFEQRAYRNGVRFVAGIDEAGRGPLAGPVVAAAVILPRDCFIQDVDDSKKVPRTKREILAEVIKQKSLAWAVGIVDERTIDEINILNAARKAMGLAVNSLGVRPDHLLIDAERIPEIDIGYNSIIKGDALSFSIAAASIIAKVTRDRIMMEYHKEYPEYGFDKHKGYGTAQHISAIGEIGLCPIHRRTFTKRFVRGI